MDLGTLTSLISGFASSRRMRNISLRHQKIFRELTSKDAKFLFQDFPGGLNSAGAKIESHKISLKRIKRPKTNSFGILLISSRTQSQGHRPGSRAGKAR